MSRFPLILALFTAALGGDLARPAWADTLRLRDGRELSGPVVFEDADRLTIDTDAGVTVLLKKDVLSRTSGETVLSPEQQAEFDAVLARFKDQRARFEARTR